MNYKFNVCVDGKWVDIRTLPEEKQKEIREQLTRKIVDAIAESEAGRGRITA